MSSCKASLCLLNCRVLTRCLLYNLYTTDKRLLSFSVVNYGRFKNRRSIPERNDKFNIDNPGVDHRLKIIKQDTPNVDSVVLSEEDIEELEGDFMNARQMKDYYDSEAKKFKHRDELKMIERKHFKQTVEPNLLTWSDKEQIRYLHKKDSLVWTIDKLSESFPATPEIINKIIKSRWRPESSDRLKKHDEIVASNWKAFDEGRLKISCQSLKEHLKKFSKRTSVPHSGYAETFEPLPKPKGSEFIGIIQSYKSMNINNGKNNTIAKSNDNNIGENKLQPYFSDDVKDCNILKQTKYALARNNFDKECSHKQNDGSPVFISNRRNYTLEKLRDKIKKQTSSDLSSLNEQDKMLLKGVSSESVAIVKPSYTAETFPIKSAVAAISDDDNKQVKDDDKHLAELVSSSGTISKFKRIQSDISASSNLLGSNISKRIHIPKNKVKIGYLYKVNDSFYSHDGFFLYRVPGMTNEND